MPWYEDDKFWSTFAPVMFTRQRMKDTADEINGFLKLSRIASGSHVLDLCCGPGRHSVALGRRGYRVTAVDRTSGYLKILSTMADNEDLHVEIVRRDVRHFARKDTFDAALIAFDSFGLFDDASEDLAVLSNVLSSLKMGARLVLEVPGKEILARGFRERWWTWLDDKSLFLEEQRVRKEWSRLQRTWTLIRGDQRQSWTFTTRLYGGAELRAVLRKAGFSRIKMYGDLDGSSYNHRAKRLVAVAER